MKKSDIRKDSRGICNNNPFNIKISPANKWAGAKPRSESSDAVFEQFYSIEFGIRAGIILIRNYIRQGFDTPRKIINKFAPDTENDTASYLWFVLAGTPYDIDDVIVPFSDYFYTLLSLMAEYESNFCKPISFYKRIVKLFNLN